MENATAKAVILAILCLILSGLIAVSTANADSHLPDCKANPKCLLFGELQAAEKWDELGAKWQSFTAADLQAMINGGADVYAKDNDGQTPLHLAVVLGKAKVIPILVKVGADVHAKDNSDNTPLHNAVFVGNAEVIPVLIKAGADVHAKDNNGNTPLHMATTQGHAEIISILLQAKADVNAKNNEGVTPLQFATQENHAEVISVLVKMGADVNATNNNGGIPLHTAAVIGNAEVISVLVQAGADVHKRTNKGRTPLHFAAYSGHAKVISILVKAGADVNAKDNEGKTPLDWVTEEKHLDAIRELEKAGAKQFDSLTGLYYDLFTTRWKFGMAVNILVLIVLLAVLGFLYFKAFQLWREFCGWRESVDGKFPSPKIVSILHLLPLPAFAFFNIGEVPPEWAHFTRMEVSRLQASEGFFFALGLLWGAPFFAAIIMRIAKLTKYGRENQSLVFRRALLLVLVGFAVAVGRGE